MTKEEELRQLEELRRIQAEEKKRIQMENYNYLEDSAFVEDAYEDSAFSNISDSTEVKQPQYIQNPISNHPPVGQPQYRQQYQQPVGQPQQRQQYQQPVGQPQQRQQYQQPVGQPQQRQQYQQPVGQPQQRQQYQQPKKRKKKHPLLKTLIIFLILIIGICGLGIGLAVKSLNKMERVETEVSKRGGNFHGDVYNILLIGQDAREGQGMQRADTIILCTINKKTHTVTLTSIMRDMYVNIPGYGGNRINAAFAFGGIDLLDQTIEENLGVKIDGNALVDFGGFMEAMTSVGNLDIELSAEEAAYLNEHPELGTTDEIAVETWNLHEGVNNLTPGQVLGYSRIRYVGNSDWDRTNRQRTVIMAVIDKIKHGHLLKGFKVLDGVAPHIVTDITTMNILKAGFAYVRCSGGGMKSFYLPAEGTYQSTYVDGMAVLLPDIEANKQALSQYMQGIDPTVQ
ncbi:MAG: LCP family protein [Lachnospiraceae bacterium]|nr:LCP family protein [Lachnospiraceae bacterium]